MPDSNQWDVKEENRRKLEELRGGRSDRPAFRGLTMLVVDDEPNVCFTLKLIFEQEGFTVSTAHSAAEGIRRVNAGEHYDLIMTDLHMEREDIGFELVRAAKKLDPPPVIIVATGYAAMANARTALDVRVDYFAIKPIELPEFLEAVRRLAGRRSDAHPASL